MISIFRQVCYQYLVNPLIFTNQIIFYCSKPEDSALIVGGESIRCRNIQSFFKLENFREKLFPDIITIFCCWISSNLHWAIFWTGRTLAVLPACPGSIHSCTSFAWPKRQYWSNIWVEILHNGLLYGDNTSFLVPCSVHFSTSFLLSTLFPQLLCTLLG